jgi:hypothetical protein
MHYTGIVVTYYRGSDALWVIEEERPEPKDGEVRVEVLAAGVCCPTSWSARASVPKHSGWHSRRDGVWSASWIGSYSQWRFKPGSVTQLKMPIEFKNRPQQPTSTGGGRRQHLSTAY